MGMDCAALGAWWSQSSGLFAWLTRSSPGVLKVRLNDSQWLWIRIDDGGRKGGSWTIEKGK